MPTSLRIRPLPIGAALLLTACVAVPTGPSVMVLPGSGASFAQFEQDDGLCRSFAAGRTGTTPNRAGTESGVTTAAVATAVGAAAGVAIGAAAGNAGAGAAIGAGSGLLLGSAAGVNRGDWNAATAQQRYDAAYMQCMYANGHQIPVAETTARAYRSAPSPPPPPAPPARRAPPLPPPGPPPPPPGSD